MPNNVNFEISQPISNHTSITLCHGNEIRWLSCINNTAINQDYTWDSNSKYLQLFRHEVISLNGEVATNGNTGELGSIKAIGWVITLHYSNIGFLPLQSIFDGTENYTLELSRGSIFETTGDVPNVNDSSTDSI